MGVGRKAKPRNLVLIQNGPASREARDLRDDEPQPPVEIPAPPDYLGAQPRAAFTMFATKLAQMRVMTAADTEAVALLAQSYADWQDAVENVTKGGPIMPTKTGYLALSPYVTIKNKCWSQVAQLLAEFGLTPASRRKVGTT